MKVTVLGCGTSAGVPMIGCHCAVCRSTDPRDKRLRCSIFVETEDRKILVDTGPDLRAQCLAAGIDWVDAILFTHAHADHIHGIDDVRSLNWAMERMIDAYADADVFDRIRTRFDYALHPDTVGFWRPVLNPIAFDGPFRVGEQEVVPILQGHGKGVSWGFRFGAFAYSPDVDALDEAAFAALAGIEVWIVDALRERPHPSHSHLEQTLAWIERVRPKRAILTHTNHEVAYADWQARLPAGVELAHDGMVIELP
ncbi:MBL fold metallo-hydrolase [Marinivivus vitaminiproducens]|uniref:MBL fold metallo-hydrolase n=1 Tax=Marinivivus vitaminiproducens TaxID=3035935 RepID=UPI0027A73A63|nr:MBL fold metallo-hydrolase [Geminicoccaceae bacterium SCSIO 64248]